VRGRVESVGRKGCAGPFGRAPGALPALEAKGSGSGRMEDLSWPESEPGNEGSHQPSTLKAIGGFAVVAFAKGSAFAKALADRFCFLNR
jgi:hypothetical protein